MLWGNSMPLDCFVVQPPRISQDPAQVSPLPLQRRVWFKGNRIM